MSFLNPSTYLHQNLSDRPIRVLFDSWFMRARLILPLLRRNMHVIGQARIDTALFLQPETPDVPRRGRPRIYGLRLNADAIEALPEIELTMRLYGKEQRVRLRSIVAVARFLRGTPVRAVWCQIYNDKRQEWTKRRLILASEVDLEAETRFCRSKSKRSAKSDMVWIPYLASE
nr:transposase [Paraburkholderia mimosarum]